MIKTTKNNFIQLIDLLKNNFLKQNIKNKIYFIFTIADVHKNLTKDYYQFSS